MKGGDVAGSKNSKGYWQVYVAGKRYKVHRILFYMLTNVEPSGKLVDHALRDASVNTGLRLATPSQNTANTQKTLYRNKKTHSKYKGVTWHKQHKKWMAQIICNRKRTHLGYFIDEKEAAKAYNTAAKEVWGEFAWLNEGC
jgi:hypothetical protein